MSGPNTPPNYVEIDRDAFRFQLRVAAVCIQREQVLLQGALDGDFWVLPGGRVLPGEATSDALRRTLNWEWNQTVEVRRLLWLMEYVAPIRGQVTHELGFYYAVDLPADSPYLDLNRDHGAVERGHQLLLRWFPLNRVSELPLFPEILRARLTSVPGTLQHIVDVSDPATNR